MELEKLFSNILFLEESVQYFEKLLKRFGHYTKPVLKSCKTQKKNTEELESTQKRLGKTFDNLENGSYKFIGSVHKIIEELKKAEEKVEKSGKPLNEFEGVSLGNLLVDLGGDIGDIVQGLIKDYRDIENDLNELDSLLENENNHLKKSVKKLKEEFKTLKEEMLELKSENKNQSKQIEELKKQVLVYENEIEDIKKEREGSNLQFERQNDAIQNDSMKKDAKIQNLERQNERSENKIEDLEIKIRELKENIESLERFF